MEFDLNMNENTEKGGYPGDDYQIRCPKLGHQIQFAYCRIEQVDFPCSKILDCWYEHFNVKDYLEEELGPETVATLSHPAPRSKVLSLVELIEQAKKNNT
jgi:hypothetical protein